MLMSEIETLVAELAGVHRSGGGAEPLRWNYRGRLVARQVDDTHLVIRADFDYRDVLVRAHPNTFTVPNRFRKHMMVVADVADGNRDAIDDALTAAWRLQREAD